ncbi:MAG: hypothetical protein ACLUD2_09475 [Clostridium sp.]
MRQNVQTFGQNFRKEEPNAMNKQLDPEHLFKHLRRNSKRILSIMLAFAILTENPLSAYASTKATPSNIPESTW